MPAFSQRTRPLRIETPLGSDVLLLERLVGEESVSEPFHFRLDLLSERADLSPPDILGKPVTVAIDFGDETRFISGIVARFAQADRTHRLTRYRASLVPQLWTASLNRDSRIFQAISVPDIAADVLRDQGVEHRLTLQRPYEPRNYCVQYRESNLGFLSRLLEEEGIHYFHEHSEKGLKLVLSDASAQNPKCPGMGARFSVMPSGSTPATSNSPLLFDVELETSVVTGKVTLWDHNFQLNWNHLDAEQAVTDAGSEEELYEYPGGYASRFDGIAPSGGDQAGDLQKIFDENQRLSNVRAEEPGASRTIVRGQSNCPFLVPGHRFALERHYRADFSATYFVRSVRHEAVIENYETTPDAPFTYRSSFVGIPGDRPYVPPRVAPSPRISGAQTAVVVGPAGSEIFTDKYGRVKVQFPWDRKGARDGGSSCWVRVGTVWAGKQWGAVHIPRIGQEVIVDFLEGDPDRPIIVGSVYNPEQMPPYALPDNMTQSGIKSRSSTGGAAENFNEIRMEDKKGSEMLTVHAENDMEVVVENDRSESVGANETISIGGNQTISVGGNRQESVGKNESVSVDGNQSLSVGGNRSRSVDKNESVSVTGDRTKSVGKSETTSVDQNRSVTIGKKETLNVGDTRTTQIGKDDQLQVGKRLLVSANDEIVLKAGQASITMKKDGTITIKGKDITLTGSGKINVKASSDVVIKGSQVKTN